MMEGYEYKYAGMSDSDIQERLYFRIMDALHKKYGNSPDEQIVKRIEKEWEAIRQASFIKEIAFLDEFTSWLRKEKYPYFLLDESAGSFILYLLQITVPNPLPPHLYCEHCHTVQWMPEFVDGFDIPPFDCAADGYKKYGDGHNLIWQFTWKSYESFDLDFFVLVPYELDDCLQEFLEMHWLKPANPIDINMWSEDVDIRGILWGRIEFCCFWMMEDINYNISTDARCYGLAWLLWTNRQLSCKENGFTDVMEIPQPQTFAELIVDYELANLPSLEAVKPLWQREGFSTKEILLYREDIYHYLMEHGYSEDDAMKIIQNCGEDPTMLQEIVKEDRVWVVGEKEWCFMRSKALVLTDMLDKIRFLRMKAAE